jgi:putative FmdB family regulatory protein
MKIPIYTYHCPECDRTFDVVRSIKDMQQQEWCDCGTAASKIIAPTRVQPDLSGYNCPITGKWIEGRRAHSENLKQHGCRVYEAGETRDFIKNKAKRDEAATDALLDRILPKSLGDTIGR